MGLRKADFQFALLFIVVRVRVTISKLVRTELEISSPSFLFVSLHLSPAFLTVFFKCSIGSNYGDEQGIIWKVLFSIPLVSLVSYEMAKCKVLIHKFLKLYKEDRKF